MNLATTLSDGSQVLLYQTPTGVYFDTIGADLVSTDSPVKVLSGDVSWLGLSPANFDGGVSIAWQDSSGQLWQEDFTAAAASNGQPYQITSPPPAAQEAFTSLATAQHAAAFAAITSDGGTATGSASGSTSSNEMVTVSKTDAAGNPVGTPSSFAGYGGSVTSVGSDGAYVAAIENVNTSNSTTTLELARFSAGGQLIDEQTAYTFQGFEGVGQAMLAGLPDGGFVAAWAQGYPQGAPSGLYIREYDAAGHPTEAAQQLGYGVLNAIEVLPDGHYVVSGVHYASPTDSTDQPFQQVFLESGAALGATDPAPAGGSGGGGSPTLAIAGPGSVVDRTSGTTDFAFTVTRSGDTSAAAAVDFYQAYGGTAPASDFAGPTAGTVYFDPGQSSAVIHIAVNGEPAGAPDQTFTIALANARGGAIDSNGDSATATIVASSAGGGGSTSVTTSDPNYAAPEGVTSITLTGTSSQTVHGNNDGDTIYSNNNGNMIFGGTGDDTFVLGRNGDHVTGGGGHDTFVFQENPWAPNGVITDFNSNDVIDLSGSLQKAGYTSGDPVAEGFLKFTNDASGNAEVWFNPEPGNSASAYWLVTGLTGVDAASLHANAGLITI